MSKSWTVKSVVWSRVVLCQLLMLALLCYGLDLSCSFSTSGCQESQCCDALTQCCDDCNVPAQLADKSKVSFHLETALVAQPFDSRRLLVDASPPSCAFDFPEDAIAITSDPWLRIDRPRGPPKNA